jgi:DNA ligase-1
MLLGDLGLAAQRALAGESLDVGLTPLVGVQPMLAGTAATVGDALAVTGPASVEWKLDGARVQVHRAGDDVRVFTRSLHEIGARVPEVVHAVLALPAQSFVLDGEALGLTEDGDPLKFQDSMSGASALRPFFFDVLHLDGRALIDEPLAVRKTALRELTPESLRLPTIDTQDAVVASQFASAAIAAGHEGVMVKALNSPYQAGRRGATWRKVKPVHTLDLVVLAAEWGHGRRTGWLSNLHLGARGADGTFVMVGKTFKGMTDDLLRWQTETLQSIALGAPEDGYVQHVRPELVVEIAVDGVQRSTRYPGGVALRFARVRRYRPDKSAMEADSIERVQSML